MNTPKRVAFIAVCATLKTGLGVIDTVSGKTRRSTAGRQGSSAPAAHDEQRPGRSDDPTPDTARTRSD